jgi:transposase-like protein
MKEPEKLPANPGPRADPSEVMIRLLYNLPKPRLESLKFLAMLMAYNSTGSWTRTAEFLGVGHRTLNDWRRAAQKRKGLLSLADDPGSATETLRIKTPRHNKSLLAKYREARDQVEQIWNLLELCRKRCKNAANFYTAGVCPPPSGKERSDACFSARLSAADARVLAKELTLSMGKVLEGED